ncbi:Uncharacterised protein [Clostridioides difficile]|nr:Uncharacterised protein [Clostridioides difficile]
MQKTMAKYTKRRDKRGYEWKSAYREKEALMLERGYPEVSPHDFYRELFPAGSLQQEPEDGKGNIIATQIRPSGKGRTRQWVIDDSLKMLDKVIGDRFGLIPPISFYGKSHTKENAHELFAVVVDVDYVGKQQLKNLLKQFGNGVQLRPTYLVSSGKGVHLYYFLQEPVQLYRNREEVLAELKEAFIRRLWNDTSSIRPDSPDITGIYQGFRCVGSQSKLGADFPVKAYKLSENRYTLEDIKASIPSCKVDLAPLYEKPRRKSTVTLEEAKELYPEWYEKRIVQGEPKQKSKKQGGTWVCNEALYEWVETENNRGSESRRALLFYYGVVLLWLEVWHIRAEDTERRLCVPGPFREPYRGRGQPFQPGRCERRSSGIERGQKKAVNDSKPGMDRGQHKGYDTSK